MYIIDIICAELVIKILSDLSFAHNGGMPHLSCAHNVSKPNLSRT